MNTEKIDGIGIRFRVGKRSKDGKVTWLTEDQHNFITEQGFDMLNTMPCTRVTEYVHLGTEPSEFTKECDCTITYDSGTYTLSTPGVDLSNYGQKKVIVKNNATFIIEDSPSGETATITPDGFSDMIKYPYSGGCIIVVDANGEISNVFESSNLYVTGSGAIRNIKYIDEDNKVVFIENTRTVVFSTIGSLMAPVNITELGWSPYSEVSSSFPLFGCKNIDVTYEAEDSPYIQVSIIRRISYDSVETQSPFDANNTIKHSLPYEIDEFDLSDCSWIDEDGNSVPPKMDSFAEINIYNTDTMFDTAIDVMLTNNPVSRTADNIEVLDRDVIKTHQGESLPPAVSKQNMCSSRIFRRHNIGGTKFIRGVDLYSTEEFNGQYIVPDRLTSKDMGEFVISSNTTKKKINILPWEYATPIETERGTITKVYLLCTYESGTIEVYPVYRDTFEKVCDVNGDQITFTNWPSLISIGGEQYPLPYYTKGFMVDSTNAKVWAVAGIPTETLGKYDTYFIPMYSYDPDSVEYTETLDTHLYTAYKYYKQGDEDCTFAMDNNLLYTIVKDDPENDDYQNYNVYVSDYRYSPRNLIYTGVYVLSSTINNDQVESIISRDPYSGGGHGENMSYALTVVGNRLIVATNDSIFSYELFDDGVDPMDISVPRDTDDKPHREWAVNDTTYTGSAIFVRTNVFVDTDDKSIVMSYLQRSLERDIDDEEYTSDQDDVYCTKYGRDGVYADALLLESVDISNQNSAIYTTIDTYYTTVDKHPHFAYGYHTLCRGLALDIIVDAQSNAFLLYTGNYSLATYGNRRFSGKLAIFKYPLTNFDINKITSANVTERRAPPMQQGSAMDMLFTDNTSYNDVCIILQAYGNTSIFAIPTFQNDIKTLSGLTVFNDPDATVYIKKLTNDTFVFVSDGDNDKLFYIQYDTSTYDIVNQGYVPIDNVDDPLNLEISVIYRYRSLIYFTVAGNSILTFRYDVNKQQMYLVYSTNAIKDIGNAELDTNNNVISNTAFSNTCPGFMVSSTGAIAGTYGVGDKRQMMLATFHDRKDISSIEIVQDSGDTYLVTQNINGDSELSKLNISKQIVNKASMTTKKIPYNYLGITETFTRISDYLYIGFKDDTTLVAYRMTSTGPLEVDSIELDTPLVTSDIHMCASEMTGAGFCLLSYNIEEDQCFIPLKLTDDGVFIGKDLSLSEATVLSQTAGYKIRSIQNITDVDFVVLSGNDDVTITPVLHCRITSSSYVISCIDSISMDASGNTLHVYYVSKYYHDDNLDAITIQIYGTIGDTLAFPPEQQTAFIKEYDIDSTVTSGSINDATSIVILSNYTSMIPLEFGIYFTIYARTDIAPAELPEYRKIQSVYGGAPSIINSLQIPPYSQSYGSTPASDNYAVDSNTGDVHVLTTQFIQNESADMFAVPVYEHIVYRIVDDIHPVKVLSFDTVGLEKLLPLKLFSSPYATYTYVKSETGPYGYLYKLNMTSNHVKTLSFFTNIANATLSKVVNIYAKTYSTGDSTPIWLGTIQNGGDKVDISNDAMVDLNSVWSRYIE